MIQCEQKNQYFRTDTDGIMDVKGDRFMPYMGDQDWWNHRFHQREWKPMKPDPKLESDWFLFQKEGRVLDVACGDGRNAIFLAENGFLVDGIDFCESALKRLSSFAEKAGVRIDTAAVDLDGLNPFQKLPMYDSIIINHYRLHPELYEDMACHLKGNGILWVNGFYAVPQDNPFVTEQDLLKDEDFSGLTHCILEDKVLYQNGSHTCVRYLWRKRSWEYE